MMQFAVPFCEFNERSRMAESRERPDFATLAVHAGETPDPATGAQNPPIYQSATFVLPDASAQVKQPGGQPSGFFYTREGNPTTQVFETKFAALEGAESGVASASGMGVISAALLTVLNPGDHLICSDAIYPISKEFISTELPRLGIDVTFLDTTNLDGVRNAIRSETRAVFVEFLSNPDLHVADLPTLASITHEHDCRLIVDNTFATPYLLRPLEHGTDLVVHSATKYISGHGDAVAGVAAGPDELIRPMRRFIARYGSPISPFNSWLLIRGVKTLALRMDRHCENAQRLAEWLVEHPRVESVMYPGLSGHPGHSLCAGLAHDRFGGMLSFALTGGERACQEFGGSLNLAYRAVSLGDVSTLVLPWTGRNLIRVSVGIEGIDDIIEDFEGALAAMSST
jgi:methionine-gamma-lyase